MEPAADITEPLDPDLVIIEADEDIRAVRELARHTVVKLLDPGVVAVEADENITIFTEAAGDTEAVAEIMIALFAESTNTVVLSPGKVKTGTRPCRKSRDGSAPCSKVARAHATILGLLA